MCISHKRLYARNPQYSAIYCRTAAPGFASQLGPHARGRDKIKVTWTATSATSARMGAAVVKRNAPVGVSADPPRAVGDRRPGVLCLSHLGSREPVVVPVARAAVAKSSSEATHIAPNRIEFAISGIRPPP